MENADLVIAGRAEGPVPGGPRIKKVGEVAEEELARLYSGAHALLVPSHYEGFGLPVLEAMQCGTPVIASRDPALLEVSGGAALHPSTPEEWVAAMRAVRRDRARYAAAGLRRAAEFSWRRTARMTWEVYGDALRAE